MNRINVYGVISPSDFDCFRDFASPMAVTFPVQVYEALESADVTQDIDLRIDSPGGYIDAGRSMIAMIQEWCDKNGRKCNVSIGGLAASMAAVMAVSFTGRVTVHECSMVMFHAAKVCPFEDATAEELRDTASALDVFNRYAAKMIARRAGIGEDEAASMIEGRKESYFGADDMIASGLADEVVGADDGGQTIQTPTVSAIRALSKTISARTKDSGGLLAAVAVATLGTSQSKGAPMPATKKKAKASAASMNEEPVEKPAPEETPPNEGEPTPQETPAPAPAEGEPGREDPSTQEIPQKEDEPAKPEETEEVKNLRAALARSEASEKAARARAEAAEKALRDAKAQTVRRAMTPPQEPSEPKPILNAAIAWREHVCACGGNTARAKQTRPDLFAAITQK